MSAPGLMEMFSNLPRVVDQHERGTKRKELGDDVETGAKTKPQLKNARKAAAEKKKFEADATKDGGFQGAPPALAIKDVRNPKQKKGAKGKGKDMGEGRLSGRH